jgi:TonB-linked SusC/RagA family outer membrane protein
MYSPKLIDANREVAIDAESAKIEDVLKSLFAGTDVEYTIKDRIIVLSTSKGINDLFNGQQQKSVSGKVTDSSGGSLPGVSVVVKGTTTGVITDIDGKYSLGNIPENATLQFSFVGMKTQELAVGNKTTINVTLAEETIGIEEVVAVGYGVQKKINLTGSVASLNAEELVSRPVPKVSNALAGQMPGVTVISASGAPGAGSVVRIRGIGTMNNSAPMVIVDGIEAEMDNVNPSDIERIDVLKDAASAAIYGTRAANGVILITTKRGVAGKSKVSYDNYFGRQVIAAFPEYLDSYEYSKLLNTARANLGTTPAYTESEIQKFKDGSDPFLYPNTDWFGLIFKGSGFQQSHNLTATGGTEQSKYLLSLGYLDQQGNIKNHSYERYNLRFNLDSKLSDKFNVSLNSSLVREESSEPAARYGEGVGRIFVEATRVPPVIPVKTANGLYSSFVGNNPVLWAEGLAGNTKTYTNRAVVSGSAELKIVDGLKLKGFAGVNHNFTDYKRHEYSYMLDGFNSAINSIGANLTRVTTITLSSFLNYQKSFDGHNVKGMLGISRESYRYDITGAWRQIFASNLLESINAGSTAGQTGTGTGLSRSLGSYFGRVNYDYKGKYLLEVSLRRDGSSKFAEGHRWGMFPSASVGWRMSEETFMKNIPIISNLKVYGSWGKLGNHNISDFLFVSKLSLGSSYVLDGSIVNGASVNSAENGSIGWEASTETNVGLDIGLFDNKLNVNAQYYNRYTDNILTTVPVPAPFGLGAPTENVGAMSNKGFEFLIGYYNKIGKKFSYNASLNLSMNKNNVEKWPTPTKGDNIRQEGLPWDSFYGLQWIGYYQNATEVANLPNSGTAIIVGDMKYMDQLTVDSNNDGVPDKGDGKINADDRIVLGNSFPATTFGLNLGATYGNFDISVLFSGVSNVKAVVNSGLVMPFVNSSKANIDHLNYWSPENPNATYPVIRPELTSNNGYFSSYYVRDASYVRLKNLQIGYTLPKIRVISKMRIFISADNLLTFTNYWKYVDPESPGGTNAYPQIKTYSMGLSVNF